MTEMGGIEPPIDSREDDIETAIRVLRWCRENTSGGPHHIDLDRLIVLLDSVRKWYYDHA